MSESDHGHRHDHTPIKMEEREQSFFEKRTDALSGVLVARGLLTVDEFRRATEDRNRPDLPYFENRLDSLIQVMVERGRLAADEVPGRVAKLAAPELSEFEKRVTAFCDVLVEHGYTSYQQIQQLADRIWAGTPGFGAKVVVRAWTDAAFKARLLSNARAAIKELGIELNTVADPELKVVENTESVHHVIVCTLCSCYPRTLLGDPPEWYKSLAYRSRIVREPRVVLREMGLELPREIELRVVDSTADLRYFVLPLRPRGTEAMNEAELERIVTRNSMIGVAQVKAL